MSFYYQYPQHPKYRGKLRKEHLGRYISERFSRWTLVSLLVFASVGLFWNSSNGRVTRYYMTVAAHNAGLKIKFY
jgi:hypothetical protein